MKWRGESAGVGSEELSCGPQLLELEGMRFELFRNCSSDQLSAALSNHQATIAW